MEPIQHTTERYHLISSEQVSGTSKIVSIQSLSYFPPQYILGQSSLSGRQKLVVDVESSIMTLLAEFVASGSAKFRLVNRFSWTNFEMAEDKTLRIRNDTGNLAIRHIAYGDKRTRHHFSIILYVLAEVHRLLLVGGSCTLRELFYKDKLLIRNQASVNSTVLDVCGMLLTTPWKLGILASVKGLIAGALRMVLSNGEIINCQNNQGATLIPPNFSIVQYLETSAAFVLLVEKDTVFKKCLSENIFDIMGVDIILITGKGYPDFSTRVLIHRLYSECSLPVYILVDADPFGIEIMLNYRHGSRSLSHNADKLSCPQIHWLGIHPSEINMLALPTAPLNDRDNRKISELLNRPYLPLGVRQELQVLQRVYLKAEIEGLSDVSFNFLINDYIPNKIKRNILL